MHEMAVWPLWGLAVLLPMKEKALVFFKNLCGFTVTGSEAWLVEAMNVN